MAGLFHRVDPVNEVRDLAETNPAILLDPTDAEQISSDMEAFRLNLALVADALVAASEQGAGVHLMTDDDFDYEEETVSNLYNQSKDAGIEVRDGN